MKKILFLVLTAGLFIAGAWYRYAFLTVLAVSLALLFLSLFAVSRLRARACAGFERTEIETEQGETVPVRIVVRELPDRLPDGPFRISVKNGSARLRLRSDTAAEGLCLHLRADHCGLMRLELEKAILQDPASLFSAACRMHPGSCTVTVWPGRLHEAAAEDLPLLTQEQAEHLIRPEAGSQEPDGVREYRPGDPLRRLHWKLSAKTDTLFLREFRDENRPVRLLDPDAWESLRVGDPDRYYTVLHDYALTVLETGEWLAVPGNSRYRVIPDKGSWHALLRDMYEKDQS